MQMAPLMKEARIVINDLADWMGSIFVGQRGRGGRKLNMIDTSASWRHRRTYGSGFSTTATPMTSETEMETETDDALMFSTAKKRTPPSSFSGSQEKEKSSRWAAKASGKDGPYVKRTWVPSSALPTPRMPANGELDSHRHHPTVVTSVPPFASIPPRLATPTQSAALKVGSPKGGQTITESELMRRRRLLDAHLIQSDSVKSIDKA